MIKKLLAGISGGLLLTLSVPMAAFAASTVTITPTNFKSVFHRGTVRPISSHDFIKGPSNPPLGVGSLELNTVDAVGKQQHLETQQFGALLSEIDGMAYSTYRHSDSTATPVQVTAINMEVDSNGSAPGGFTTLVFEPVYNTSQGTVQEDVWQDWDAYSGGEAIWWSSQPISGVCAFTCYVTWDQIVAANPDATVISYGVNQGGGNPGLHANVDALSISVRGNNTMYDFEPYIVATNKDQCKNNGYKNMRDADGKPFKNQGQCVSYVASNGRSAR